MCICDLLRFVFGGWLAFAVVHRLHFLVCFLLCSVCSCLCSFVFFSVCLQTAVCCLLFGHVIWSLAALGQVLECSSSLAHVLVYMLFVLLRGMVSCCSRSGTRVLFRMVGLFCLYYVCHIRKVVSMTHVWYGWLLRSGRNSSAFLDRLLVCSSALASFLFYRRCRC